MKNYNATPERTNALKLQDQFVAEFDGFGIEKRLEYAIETETGSPTSDYVARDTYALIFSQGPLTGIVWDVDRNYVCETYKELEEAGNYDDAPQDVFDNYLYTINNLAPTLDEKGNYIDPYSDGRYYSIYEDIINVNETYGLMVYPEIRTPRQLELWIYAATTSDYMAAVLGDDTDESKRKYTPSWSYKLVTPEIAENIGQNYESLVTMLQLDLDLQNIFV